MFFPGEISSLLKSGMIANSPDNPVLRLRLALSHSDANRLALMPLVELGLGRVNDWPVTGNKFPEHLE